MAEVTYSVDLGRMQYQPALELQHRLVAARQEDRLPDVLLLVEHEPVITLGRRARPEHIVAAPEVLTREGIEVHHVERGGDVTYHGPGQLVGYPIMDLRAHPFGSADYVHRLEDVLIAALADFGLAAGRREGYVGVWLGNDKVAALGVRIARGVSFHGFALNVHTNLSHFGLIVPCGITDGGVTSMERALGRPVAWEAVQERVRAHFARVYRTSLQEISREELAQLLNAPPHSTPRVGPSGTG